MRARRALPLLLLAACATYDEEREVVFPRGEPAPACDRPEPRPALAKGGTLLLSSWFHRRGAKRAVESARVSGGIYLQVLHRACGPESQVFRFHMPRGEPPPPDAAAHYELAAKLLEGVAAPGSQGAALRELAVPLSTAAAKGKGAPPLGTRLELGEFQELMVTRSELPRTSAYGWVLVVSYRLKL